MRVLSLALLTASSTAYAQDDGAPASEGDAAVREIVRGFFLKSNIGSTLFFGVTAPRVLSGVMSIEIGVGQDFIDRERFSAAWEIDLVQGLFNGPRTEELPSVPGLVEGDIHAFTGLGGVEVSTYVTRRLGIGLRGGGGVMYAPLLMHPDEYNAVIVPSMGGVPARVHQGPLPVAYGGPTLEYYTKLSHFSVGAEADVMFVIGFDLAITPTGYLKYTF